jgi:hypothetical protein
MRNICLYYMSSQVPPDPILTTYKYWNWLNVDEETRRQRALDNTYMRFPTVQNNPTTFLKMFVIIRGLVDEITSVTRVNNVLTALRNTVNTWSGSNTMTIGTSTVTAPIDMNYEPSTFLSTQRGYVVSTPITTGLINGSNVATLSIPTPGLWWIYFSVHTSINYQTGTIVQVFDGATLLAQSFQNNLTNGFYSFSTLKVSTTLSFDTGTKSITFPCGAGGGGIGYNGGNCFAIRMG